MTACCHERDVSPIRKQGFLVQPIMRVLAPLALATLSLSALSLGSPLDNQAVLLSDNFVQEPRWKYRTCGMSPSRPLLSGLI